MSIFVQKHVWTLDLPPHLKYVAVALADHAHDDGYEARPSQEYLALKTGLSVRTVRRALAELKSLGVIILERPAAKGRCNVWYFPAPKGGFERSSKTIKGRSSTTLGRSSTTLREVTGDPLIISNHKYKEEESISESVSDEFLALKLSDIRKAISNR